MQRIQSRGVLIVDDSEDNHTLLCTFFEAYGIEPCSAFDGREALNLLRETSNLPQVILLDNHMPTMCGTEFRRAQMADPCLRDIPVIMISADDEIPHADDLVEPRHLFTKPLDIDVMISEVLAILVDSAPSSRNQGDASAHSRR